MRRARPSSLRSRCTVGLSLLVERDALLDDVMTQQGRLAVSVLADAEGDLDAWIAQRESFLVEWRRVIGDAQHATQQDFSMFAMTCRKLSDLARLGD